MGEGSGKLKGLTEISLQLALAPTGIWTEGYFYLPPLPLKFSSLGTEVAPPFAGLGLPEQAFQE